ncbi:uncharacterized protein LOC114479773 [Gouania willdenowi]|uniref:uncharacterized protein LOC114479773 n=1 Tax=Gouania willdenowi TaxID=441366 RepID=UPI0010549331|nr:uncharacterized protein LOC114479773 [Gouania willdenowi]
MYAEGTKSTGYNGFLPQNNTSIPCRCQQCARYEQSWGHHGAQGCQPAPNRQMDHPSLDCRSDIQSKWVKDVEGNSFAVDRVERSHYCSPQRRPMSTGPDPYSHPHEPSQVCPWTLKHTQWNYHPEPMLRNYSYAREPCCCVMHNDTRTLSFIAGIPHPLPHLQVKGQGNSARKGVRYVNLDEEVDCGCSNENYYKVPHNSMLCHLQLPNGHYGSKHVFFEEKEEGDTHQEESRLKGGSEEGTNGCGGSHRGFFPTEIPQMHLKQRRRMRSSTPSSTGIMKSEPPKSEINGHQHQCSEVVKQRRSQDLVRDQIRQVVTDLEDVLGGLKQVHIEMKEVVDQIDRLTANIDLREETPCITHGSTDDLQDTAHSGVPSVSQLTAHRLMSPNAMQHADEDHIILRTHSPSPVHMASVVKTNRFSPPGLNKDTSSKKLASNGHPFHRCSNHTIQTYREPQPQTLEPKVIIQNGTANSKTQKPPLYPQNGRCGKGSHLPQAVRTSVYPGKGCQSTSMV